MKWFLAVVVAILVVKSRQDEDHSKPKLWAVLVAGSNYYYNYRHQADVCHAYQILHSHGIPDERIIVMMYDDVANNEENPTKGILINKPGGKDVYHGVPKDYVKDTVVPANFLKILKGEVPAGGSGKTLKAGPNDHVFVNFVDHGAPGILAFPGEAPVLTAKDFLATLKQISADKKFAKMVLYVEACESGSMFKNILPNNLNIFATTAANDHESSYACYFDKKRDTYLGDLYSVNWMEDTDRSNIEKLTLENQFKITKQETNLSHCEQFGDMNIAKMDVGEFQGLKNPGPPSADNLFNPPKNDAVVSTDVPMKILEQKIASAENMEKKLTYISQLKSMLEKRRQLKTQMFKLANSVATDVGQSLRITSKKRDLTDLDCHDTVVKHFDKNCLGLGQNTYAMRFVYLLVNMCEEKIPTATIISKIDEVCAPLKAANGGFYL